MTPRELEESYLEQSSDAEDALQNEISSLPNAKAIRDVDGCKRLGEGIARVAHKAKLWRYCAEAAVRECGWVDEDGDWESHFESHLDRALYFETLSLRLFTAWVMDAEQEIDRTIRNIHLW